MKNWNGPDGSFKKKKKKKMIFKFLIWKFTLGVVSNAVLENVHFNLFGMLNVIQYSSIEMRAEACSEHLFQFKNHTWHLISVNVITAKLFGTSSTS